LAAQPAKDRTGPASGVMASRSSRARATRERIVPTRAAADGGGLGVGAAEHLGKDEGRPSLRILAKIVGNDDPPVLRRIRVSK
jgi:hypothetical protein